MWHDDVDLLAYHDRAGRSGLKLALQEVDGRFFLHVSALPVYPPLGSTIAVHSAVPLPERDVVVINSEALCEECDEPASLRTPSR
jgi:hypothetical protein